MHHTGMLIRAAFQNDTPPDERLYAIDYFLYLWCGPDSILFDKSKMATFERYFIPDKATHKEEKGNYFKLRDNQQVVEHILDQFQVQTPNRHIINGHVPVHAAEGENPIKANGRLMVIDGGFSQPYHKTTGIAGYTLVYHSRGFQLVQHEPFTSSRTGILRGKDSAPNLHTTSKIRRYSCSSENIGREKQLSSRWLHEDRTQITFIFAHSFIGDFRGPSHKSQYRAKMML